MKELVGLTFFTILLAAACASAQETVSLRTAIDVAFNNIVKSGKFASVSNKYGLNSTKPACTGSSTSYPSPSGLLKTILDTRSISICRSYPVVFPFWNATSNTGFVIDLINGILDEWNNQYGKKPTISWHYSTYKEGYFTDLQTTLTDGTCHVVADIVTFTAPRALIVDFACPYTSISSGFLRGPLEAFRTNLTTLAALNDPSVKVGVLKGSVYDSAFNGVPKAQKVVFPDDTDAVRALVNQTIHATLMDSAFISLLLDYIPCADCKYYSDGRGTQDYAMFVKKTSVASIATSSFVSLILMMLLSVLLI